MKKTKVMEVSNKVHKKYRWFRQTQQLEQVKTYNYLGVTFDEEGSFKKHKMDLQRNETPYCWLSDHYQGYWEALVTNHY